MEVDQNPINVNRQNRAAVYSSRIVIIVAVIILIPALIYAYLKPELPQYILAGAYIYSVVSGFISLLLSRLSKRTPAVIMLVVGIIISCHTTSIIFSGVSLFISILLLIVIALLTTKTTESRISAFILLVTMTVSGVVIIVDQVLSTERPRLLPEWLVSIGGVILALFFILFISFQFSSYPFRYKLLFSFMTVAISAVVTVAVVSVLNTRTALNSSANQSLNSASSQTAASLDAFIYNISEMLEIQAQNPSLYQYLSVNADQRTYELFRDANNVIGNYVSRNALGRLTAERQAFVESYMLVDRNGVVLIDSRRTRVGDSLIDLEYIRQPLAVAGTYTSPVLFDRDNQAMMYFSTRVVDILGQVVGVLIVSYEAEVLQNVIVSNNDLIGPGSYGLLMDENYLRLAQGGNLVNSYRVITPVSEENSTKLQDGKRLPKIQYSEIMSDMPGLGELLSEPEAASNISFRRNTDDRTRYLGVITSLEAQPWSVIYIQSEELFLAPVQKQLRNLQLAAVIVAMIAGVMGIIFAQVLIGPITKLTKTAQVVTTGDYSARAIISTRDEFSILASAFNTMTDNLAQMLSGLEKRVQDRTRDLEARSTLIAASADIGSTAVSIHDVNELLPKMAHMISEKFGFYHIGIFLLDESGKFAVLRAANSEGGLRMLARGHRLEVGQQGIVEFVTKLGEPRIALDVGEDAIFFNNPDLPETRSEIALPLFASRNLIGALDVQSNQPSAFTREDISILQVMANLLSVAIDNARLFQESQAALESTRRAYGELSKQAWTKLKREQAVIGYRSLDIGIVPLTGNEHIGEQTSDQSLSIPIKVRDNVIGYLDTYKPPEQGGWTNEEYELLYAFVDQIGIAMESARLYETSVIQAERERLVGQISTRMRGSNDPQTIIQTTVAEIKQVLNARNVQVVIRSLSRDERMQEE